MLYVHKEWDPLKVCVVGKNYPPEFYSFMKNPKLRSLFEKMAIEIEEDYQSLIKILEKFNVEVLRPNVPQVVPQEYIDQNLPIPGPISSIPRDQMIMMGEKFFVFPYYMANRKANYNLMRDFRVKNYDSCWEDIIKYVESKGNEVINNQDDEDLAYLKVNGMYRIGKDVFFGTKHKIKDYRILQAMNVMADKYLKDYRTWAITTGGHIDGVFSTLKPGLIFSAFDADSYEETFPGWEVVYFEENRLNALEGWEQIKRKNHGKWWLPNMQDDDDLIEYIEHWLKDWLGYVEETIFDVNLLMIDEKNAVVSTYNEKAWKAFERHGITPHISPMRHRFFWDGGIHCVTAELHREGVLEDVFK